MNIYKPHYFVHPFWITVYLIKTSIGLGLQDTEFLLRLRKSLMYQYKSFFLLSTNTVAWKTIIADTLNFSDTYLPLLSNEKQWVLCITCINDCNQSNCTYDMVAQYRRYCNITFGNVFFLAPLAVESLHQIKYTAKCAFIKVWISGYKSTTKSNPR